MSLSNSRVLLLLSLLCAGILQGCTATPPAENVNAPTPAEESKRFPFPTSEPDVYQADVVVTTLGTQTHYFVARKGEYSRLDLYRGGKLATTSLGTDAIYTIDHTARTYKMTPSGSGRPPVANDVARDFFQRGMPFRYDELDRKDGVIRYKARDAGIVVSIDETSGLMVRQEFSEDGETLFVYELRNVKLDVDDAVFQVPAGYRRVTK
ncbi:MAG: hypothetical protein IPM59_01360 [Chloracidobacterium sp.]|nr:hypothetical protein [Chloracidobacterium sp.]